MTLRSIEVAEEILELIVSLEDTPLEDAIMKLSRVEGTWGLLWGLGNLDTSGMDLDYYILKRMVLEFCQHIRNDRRFPLAILVNARRLKDKEAYENKCT